MDWDPFLSFGIKFGHKTVKKGPGAPPGGGLRSAQGRISDSLFRSTPPPPSPRWRSPALAKRPPPEGLVAVAGEASQPPWRKLRPATKLTRKTDWKQQGRLL